MGEGFEGGRGSSNSPVRFQGFCNNDFAPVMLLEPLWISAGERFFVVEVLNL